MTSRVPAIPPAVLRRLHPNELKTMMHSKIPAYRSVAALAAAILAAAAGCSSASTDVGEPLSITLSVDRSSGAAAVDVFSFHYEATGTDLLGIVLEFGDGQADSLAAQGAARASATRSHVYETPGTYSASAWAHEALGATKADTVVVEVRSP